MEFDLVTIVRVSNENLFDFIKECNERKYDDISSPFGIMEHTHNTIVLCKTGMTPAQAEAFIQFCVRYNVPEVVMPA